MEVKGTPEQVAALFAALAKAQGDFEAVHKDSKSHHGTYADLRAVQRATIPALTSNGLAILQTPGLLDGDCVILGSMLTHASGGFVEFATAMPVVGSGPQKVGSAITYARRYAWQAICGVAGEDDDGNLAQGQTQQPKRRQAPEPPAEPKTWGDAERKRYHATLGSLGYTHEQVKDWLAAEFDAPSPSVWSREKRNGLLATLAVESHEKTKGLRSFIAAAEKAA